MFRQSSRKDILFEPLRSTGIGFYAFVVLLLAVIAWGAYAYYLQLRDGLVVTGLRDYVFWGIYMTNFVFFIGISHAGTLISAILRVTRAGWRRPITRMAEAITVFALMIGAPMIIIDMGHPERILNLLLYGRLQSPILWDLISITTYLTGSLMYLYLPMIPDLALCRDRLTDAPAWKQFMYRVLAMGWHGDEEQKRKLERGVAIMAVLIIPIAVSVHTVVSWIFGMTLRPGWHSTIFGPYFVVGAIFSGIASILIAMVIFRRVYHLEAYLEVKHFRNLGLLLLVMDLIYIYFTLSEYLTMLYGNERADQAVLQMLFGGDFALPFWAMVLGGFVLPALMLALPNLVRAPARARAPFPVLRPVAVAAAVAVLALITFAPRTSPTASLQVASLLPLLRLFSIVAALGGLFWLALPLMRAHPIATVVTASVLVNAAMWLKRYIIIVPTLYNPRIPIQNVPSWEWAHYAPTWVEWSITAGAFAAFILLYALFSKIFPIVSIWETFQVSQETLVSHETLVSQETLEHAPARVEARAAEGGANV
ncbi:MAG: polysulfide reductase NrfD [Chloroflexi bacterium]|nr:polysulfide reductase NrfD [Chloroflexota bacterium]